jgi:enoyl-CoA hydratase
MNNVQSQLQAGCQDVLIDQHHDGVVVITINRPDARNALRNQTLDEIGQVLEQIQHDATVRVVVITGGNTLFAAGADLKEMEKLSAIETLQDIRPLLWKRIAGFNKPLIGAVNGYALGAGCELVMHMDIVIAGDNAKFGQPEINLGLIPGAGGTQRLVRTVGKPLAMKMVLSGEAINAQTALTSGLVAEVVADDHVLERALILATTIAKKSPLAVGLAKEAILRSFETGLAAGLDFERKSFSLLAASDDRKEGISAFLEKRIPVFTGK